MCVSARVLVYLLHSKDQHVHFLNKVKTLLHYVILCVCEKCFRPYFLTKNE